MESLLDDTLIPIICEKVFDIKPFVIGFGEYRTIGTPLNNELLAWNQPIKIIDCSWEQRPL